MSAKPRSIALILGVLMGAASLVHAAPSLVRTMDNGIRVAVFSDHRLPIVQIQVLVPAGARHEKPLESGAASLAALLLTRGTSSRSEIQYAHDVETLGGTVVGDAARDYATLSGAFRSVDLDRGLELVADAVINPIFDDVEIDAARQEMARRVVESRTRPDVVAEEHAWALAMKGHPYAIPEGGTFEGAAALTRARVIGFHRAQYRPDHALVAVAGDVDPESAFVAVQEAFGRWGGRTRNLAPRSAAEIEKPAGLVIRIVDVPGAEEAELRYALRVPPRGADDAPALAVANDLLGGSAGSRLGGDGRVLKAYSQLDQQREAGLLIIATSAKNDSVAASLARVRNELRRYGTVPPSPAEVERSRRILSRVFPLRNETLGAQAAQWLTASFLGLGNDYPDRYPAKLQSVTAENVRDVAQRYFDPDHADVVVVGAAAALQPTLAALGTVEVVSLQAPAVPVVAAPAFRMDEPDEAALQMGRKHIQQAISAHGGLAKLKSIKDSKVEADLTLYRSGQSVIGKQVELRREPGQLRTETTFMQLATVQAVHGDTAWTRMNAGKADSTIQEDADGVAAMQRAFGSDVPHLLLLAADPKSRVSYRGQDDVGSILTDVVEVVSAQGVRWVLFLDPAHRVLAAEDNQGSPLQGSTFRRVFGELRPVQGILLPFSEERLIDGQRTLTLRMSRVTINTGISPLAFQSKVPPQTTTHRRR